VLDQCRDHALATREPYGIWGGLSEGERALLLGVRTLRHPGPRERSDRRPRRPATTNGAQRENRLPGPGNGAHRFGIGGTG
jgi:WhiB family redox-sensing transcriptional regulator